MLNKKMILLLTMIFSLSGCAVSNRQPLTVAARSQLHPEHLLLYSQQNKILAEATTPPNSNSTVSVPVDVVSTPASILGAGIGNMIGSLIIEGIDNVEIKHAQAAMLPINDDLNDFNFVSYFQKSLQNQLQQKQSLKIKSTSVAYDSNGDNLNTIIDHSGENIIFLVNISYYLNNNLTALKIVADTMLEQNQISDPQNFKALYHNDFVFIYHLPKIDSNRNDAIKAWTQSGGALIHQVMQDGAKNLAEQIAIDINNPNQNLYSSMKNKDIDFLDEYGYLNNGKLVMIAGDYNVIRGVDDTIYVINDNSIKK